MSRYQKKLKDMLIKGMQAVGDTASNIASNTKFKVSEMTLVNRRREILSDFGQKSYALWQKGEKFPEELENELKELAEVDEQLNALRAERFTGVEEETIALPEDAPDTECTEESGEETDVTDGAEDDDSAVEVQVDETDATVELCDEPDDEIPSLDMTPEKEEQEKQEPLSDAINDLFRKPASPDEMAGKVNEALDHMDESMRKFNASEKES